jgi:hypothetical protein
MADHKDHVQGWTEELKGSSELGQLRKRWTSLIGERIQGVSAGIDFSVFSLSPSRPMAGYYLKRVTTASFHTLSSSLFAVIHSMLAF